MTPQQFLLALWAWRKMVLIVFVSTTIIGTAITFLLPKRYMATTSIVVDVKADPILGALMPAMASPTYMTTQTEIIQSDRVAMRVVKQLGLEKNPVFVDQWRDATDGQIPFENFYGAMMKRGLSITPSRGSNIINLNYTGQDPAFAAAVANTYAQAYIDVSIDLRVDPARQYAAWFDERMKTLRANLLAAQEKLSNYQKEKGIVVTSGVIDQETERLSSLNTQLASVLNDKVVSKTTQKNTGSEASPDVQQSGVIAGLKSELAKSEARLNELGINIGKNHPSYQQLEAQIAGIKQQLTKEIHRISGSTAMGSRVIAQQEEELTQLIEEQKKRVLSLRAEYDEISVLTKDVQAAQQAYDTVAQRLSQVSLESKSEQTNLSVLSPALAPIEPYSPRIPKFLLASVGGGLILSMALALVLELLDRRVRKADDLRQVEGVPMLGVLQDETKNYTLKQRMVIALRLLNAWRRRLKLRRKLVVEPSGA